MKTSHRQSISKAKKGMIFTEEHKKRLKESKREFYRTERGSAMKEGLSLRYKGVSKPEHSKALTGRRLSLDHRKKIGQAQKGRKTGFDSIEVTDQRIKKEFAELESQGFRCVPVGGKVRPDIIGIKDGKVYAIEVEYRARPDYAKYDDKTRGYFDGVIWITRHKYAKNKPTN